MVYQYLCICIEYLSKNGALKVKILSLIAALVFVNALAILGGCHEANTPKALVVGLSAEYPPFEFIKDGKIAGFDVEIAEALGQVLGVAVEIKDISFNSLIPALKNNRIDIAISGLSVTDARKENVDFSDIYYQNTLALIFNKNAPIDTFEEWNGKKMGVQTASTMEQFAQDARKLYGPFTIVTLNTNPPLIEELKLKRIDGVVLEMVQAKAFCDANTSLSFKEIGTTKDGYAIALKKGSPLLNDINQALLILENNGSLTTLKKKWIGN